MAAKKVKTRFVGVRYREHSTRKHGVGFDRYFFIRYRLNGKLIEEGLGWSSEGMTAEKASVILAKLKEARRTGEGAHTLYEKRKVERQKREADAAELERTRRENITLDEIMDTYLEWAKTNKRHWKNDEYRYRLHIQPFLGEKPMREITPFAIEKLKKELQGKGLALATLKHCLCIIRQVFNKAYVWGKFDGQNPMKKVSMPKLSNAKLRAITYEEEKPLLDELARRSMDVHDQALTALYAGLRYEEIANMEWRDVDLSARLLIVRGKGDKIRRVPIGDMLMKMFRRRMQGKVSEFVFPNNQKAATKKISHTYWRAVEAVGLNQDGDRRFRVDFHALRHTFATRLASNGTPITLIRDLLGHADLQMTSRYSHVMPGQGLAAVQGLENGFRESVIEMKTVVQEA